MESIVGHSQVSETKLEKWELLQIWKGDKYIYHIAKRKNNKKAFRHSIEHICEKKKIKQASKKQ